ncbi:Wzz/FepE/Etk N-terminal domain-containing protein [uncultured Sphingobacterium sp.]|uniref:Wzz/FepE/Etk N-terminal domain-containing protein n=1 Tax=uncultured Sphingobacterium sp. TaxID=182688 RepID=UPI0025D53A18|nr:Wzz/FepE/Etk N-terminal domain-containing protein [uncultured Sphingobacterium sp.]
MKETNNLEKISLKDILLKVGDLFSYLVSRWYIILIFGVFGGLLGFFYAKLQKPAYKSTTTFVLESGDGGSGGLGQMAGLAALAGVDLGPSGGGIFQGDNLFELYKSRKMIELALLQRSPSDSSLLLLDRYLTLTNEREKWKESNPELMNIDFLKALSSTQARLRDSILQQTVQNINKTNLDVGHLDKKSSLIKVDVKSPDEVFSKEFNEAIVDQVNNFYIKTKTKKSLDNIEILQRKTDSVRAVMNGAITSSAVIVDVTPNLNPTKQSQRLIPAQRSQFSVETNRAILGQLVQNLEMAKMALLKETPLIQVIDQPLYPLQIIKIGKLKSLIIGGILASFICVIILLGIKSFRDLMSS